MSANDVTPIRSNLDEPMPLILLTCLLGLTTWLTLTALWLLIRHERETMAKTAKQVTKTAKVVGVQVLNATADILRRTDQAVRRTSLAIRLMKLGGNRRTDDRWTSDRRTSDRRTGDSPALPGDRGRSSTAQHGSVSHRQSAFNRLSTCESKGTGSGDATQPAANAKARPIGLPTIARGRQLECLAAIPSSPPPSPPAPTPRGAQRQLCRFGYIPVKLVEMLVTFFYLVGRKILGCAVAFCTSLFCTGEDGAPKRLAEAPWIELSPGLLVESEAHRRSRSARNHVRTMLLGRRGYPIYKKRQGKSFCYPQRLWMALALSLWVQVLMTLFFVNSVRWITTALAAAQDFDAKVRAEAQHHAAVDEATRFAPTFRTIMLFIWVVRWNTI